MFIKPTMALNILYVHLLAQRTIKKKRVPLLVADVIILRFNVRLSSGKCLSHICITKTLKIHSRNLF